MQISGILAGEVAENGASQPSRPTEQLTPIGKAPARGIPSNLLVNGLRSAQKGPENFEDSQSHLRLDLERSSSKSARWPVVG